MNAMKKFAGGQDKPVQQQGGNMQSGVSFFNLPPSRKHEYETDDQLVGMAMSEAAKVCLTHSPISADC
jgi:hypothetical protein